MPSGRGNIRKRSRNELSAGGVVYRLADAGPEVLLIRPKREDGKESWSFPKGWTGDHGPETLEQTALREVREEGGVEARIVEDLGEIHYIFTWEGEKVFKTVHYYLMEYISGDPGDHDHEVEEARFVSLEEVPGRLRYKNEQEFFKKAADRIRSIIK